MGILQQIREEIEKRGLTDYRIAKDTGIPLSTVQRIRAGADAQGANIDKLLEYLGAKTRLKFRKKVVKS